MSSQEMWTVSQYCLVPMVLMLFMALSKRGLSHTGVAEERHGTGGNGNNAGMKGRSALATECQRNDLVDIQMFYGGIVAAFGWMCDDFIAARGDLEVGKTGKTQHIPLGRAIKLCPNGAVVKLVIMKGRRVEVRLRP